MNEFSSKDRKIFEDMKHKEFFNTIVTIRLSGKLKEGTISDIDFRQIYERIYAKGAYFIMKNTSGLESKEFHAVKVGSSDEIEHKLIEENINQIKISQDEKKLIHELMHLLNKEKEEDEKAADFEKRVVEDALKVIEIKKKAL